jgi:hypothetical protein
VEDAAFLGQSHDVLGDVLGLEIDRNQDVVLSVLGHQLQDFLHGRHPLPGEYRIEPAPGVEFSDLGQRHFGDPARTVRGSVHGVIVDAHQSAILRSLHVELEAETEFETRPEIRKRVLGGVAQQTSVSDGLGTAFSGDGVETGCGKVEKEWEDTMGCGHGCAALIAGVKALIASRGSGGTRDGSLVAGSAGR